MNFKLLFGIVIVLVLSFIAYYFQNKAGSDFKGPEAYPYAYYVQWVPPVNKGTEYLNDPITYNYSVGVDGDPYPYQSGNTTSTSFQLLPGGDQPQAGQPYYITLQTARGQAVSALTNAQVVAQGPQNITSLIINLNQTDVDYSQPCQVSGVFFPGSDFMPNPPQISGTLSIYDPSNNLVATYVGNYELYPQTTNQFTLTFYWNVPAVAQAAGSTYICSASISNAFGQGGGNQATFVVQ
jgi:hypothetical protein